LHATRAAVEAGIVPGGGTTLAHFCQVLKASTNKELGEFELSLHNDDERNGAKIILEALEAPFRQIFANAGYTEEQTTDAIEAVYQGGFGEGWDVATGERVNMFDTGIIDPAKVPMTALENAASVAGIMLTINAAIVFDMGHEPVNDDQ